VRTAFLIGVEAKSNQRHGRRADRHHPAGDLSRQIRTARLRPPACVEGALRTEVNDFATPIAEANDRLQTLLAANIRAWPTSPAIGVEGGITEVSHFIIVRAGAVCWAQTIRSCSGPDATVDR
jgi:hypothetical protein